jgi:thiol:disulfide interchange protein DsbD
MIARLVMISVMICGTALAGARPGRATLDWIAESPACEPGKPLQTAIRMVHDSGWHSYWINPGEAGIRTTATWKLPPGWKNGGLGFPEPARFLTNGLAGFGYAGSVLLPVVVTPPADFTGTARLTAVISWLACGKDGCLPGEAEIHLDLAAGAPEPTADARDIRAASQKLPRIAGNVRLAVTEKAENLILSIETDSPAALDLDGREAFPATPDVVDPRVPVRFVKNGGAWTAKVSKSEYAASPVKALTLVIAATKTDDALELTWNAP